MHDILPVATLLHYRISYRTYF